MKKISPIFSLLVIVLLLVILLSSCDSSSECIKGEGAYKTETIIVDDFNSIWLRGSMNVYVTEGSEQKVTISGHPNLIDKLKTRVVDSTWKIELQNGCYSNYNLDVNITSPNIDNYVVEGSGNIKVDAFRSLENLNVEVKGSGGFTGNGQFKVANSTNLTIGGSGKIIIDVQSDQLKTINTGSGQITLSGQSREQDIDLLASGSLLAFDLESKFANVYIDGSGNADIFITEGLKVNIGASGNVMYKGKPTISSTISGSGRLVNAN